LEKIKINIVGAPQGDKYYDENHWGGGDWEESTPYQAIPCTHIFV
jgi:hypothetical protein